MCIDSHWSEDHLVVEKIAPRVSVFNPTEVKKNWDFNLVKKEKGWVSENNGFSNLECCPKTLEKDENTFVAPWRGK